MQGPASRFASSGRTLHNASRFCSQVSSCLRFGMAWSCQYAAPQERGLLQNDPAFVEEIAPWITLLINVHGLGDLDQKVSLLTCECPWLIPSHDARIITSQGNRSPSQESHHSRRVPPLLALCVARISCSRLCRSASHVRSSRFKKYALSGLAGSANCTRAYKHLRDAFSMPSQMSQLSVLRCNPAAKIGGLLDIS